LNFIESHGSYASRTCFQGSLLLPGQAPSRQAGKPFSKNASIVRSSTRAETSAEMTLQEQLAGEQESTTVLVKLVDELNKKTKESKREFEEFNKRQQEYNRLCEQVMRLSSPGN
jgi:hypothetical protein